uniref:Uncharacterized protein n=1 Tax=Magallana gigas TaxID=29159 RepID=K1RG34_MAGGI
MADAGYYYGGAQVTPAGLDGGVVLIVKGKPSKPDIIGDPNVEENKYVDLTCSSQSTSAPDYYSKLVILSYTWFVNDTKMESETRGTLSLYVTRKLKYKKYSCTATEEYIESDRSDPVQINPLYRPEQPLNFIAYSYASGYVNMTWTSGFNGGSEQFFILRMRDDTDWKIIANLTDPGKGGTVHFDHGPLTPGQEILYRLESCNIITCSIQSVEMTVNVKDTSKASLTSTSEMVYAAIGVSTGVSILIVILVVVLVIFFRRKNEKNNIMDNEITQDGTEMYAVVDKSKTSNDKMKDKTGTSGATKDDYGYNRNSTSGMYAAVDKSLPKENKLEATISTKYSTDKKEDESHHGTETYAVVDKSIMKKGILYSFIIK